VASWGSQTVTDASSGAEHREHIPLVSVRSSPFVHVQTASKTSAIVRFRIPDDGSGRAPR